MRAAAGLALLAALGCGSPAAAQMLCDRLPPRNPPPAEARPAPVALEWWQQRQQVLEQLNGTDLSGVRLLFLGDSITQNWAAPIFAQFYGHRAALNMGVGSDTTQGMLWRLARSPLGASLKPELVVLMLGTNNAHNPRSDEVATGIAEVVRMIRARSPSSKILLLGILPRGATPQDPFRPLVREVNNLISTCASEAQRVTFLDPGPLLLDAAGNLSEVVAPDRLHPSAVGYAIIATAIEWKMRELMGR